jgi:hypothetical protein
MKLRKIGVVLLALLLAAMAMVPMVSAAVEKNQDNIVGKTVPAPQTMDINLLKSRHISDSDSHFLIMDLEVYLTFWNEKMNWGLSEKQIHESAKKMEDEKLKTDRFGSGNAYEISDIGEFSKVLQQTIGITDKQTAEFIIGQKEQIRSDYQNFQDPSESVKLASLKSVVGTKASSTTQSAPSATGDLYTAIIFTDFQIPGEEGVWPDSHKEDAYYDAWVGTNQIETQADSRAGVDNNLGYYTVTVSGQNTGDNSAAWGSSGWMERAARNLGYSDSNSDGRYTDDMARALRISAGADSVMLMFLTHDATRSYAIGPDQGYADKAAIGYWYVGSGGVYYFSTQFHYEHEALHLYGALDEYTGVSYCGQSSILAVDPMLQFYTNTNHANCAGSTSSVMRDLGQTVISDSTKRFIGWGDHDNDGTLDPFDSTP